MMIKKQFAKIIFKNEFRKIKGNMKFDNIYQLIENPTPEFLKFVIENIIQSSIFAIATEVLGLLDSYPDYKSYTTEKDGIMYHYVDFNSLGNLEQAALSFRDILQMLPDDVPNEKNDILHIQV